jgi:hypothetical protein
VTKAETRAAAWLKAWDAQSFHRTGTEGDMAGAAWLAGEAAALGAAVEIEEFALDRLDPVDVFLELGGERIEGVPLFDAAATAAAGISGRLGPVGGDAEIGVAALPPRAVYSGEYRRLQQQGGHRGLVIVCAGDEPGFGLLNAEGFRAPYAIPAIHLSSEAGERVLAAASRGGAGRLVSDSRRTPTRARNVIVQLAGRDPEGQRLVVTTPRSSWWQSTAERGGGLVCWLEIMRALLAAPPAGEVVFAALSGHELGHLGFDDFLARRPGWDSELSVLSTSEKLRARACDALSRAGQPPDLVPPSTTAPSGETRDIHLAGGTHLTVVGTNRWFHLPQDRWPDTVDLAAVTRIARAAADCVVALTC